LETLSSLYIRHDGSVPFTGKQSMGGFNLTNVLDPIGNQDAATKSYVDSKSVTFTLCSNLSMIYPINVVMITTNNVSPATSLGCGNWSSLGTGYALVGI